MYASGRFTVNNATNPKLPDKCSKVYTIRLRFRLLVIHLFFSDFFFVVIVDHIFVISKEKKTTKIDKHR